MPNAGRASAIVSTSRSWSSRRDRRERRRGLSGDRCPKRHRLGPRKPTYPSGRWNGTGEQPWRRLAGTLLAARMVPPFTLTGRHAYRTPRTGRPRRSRTTGRASPGSSATCGAEVGASLVVAQEDTPDLGPHELGAAVWANLRTTEAARLAPTCELVVDEAGC
jgi:hypothetical protein